MRLLSTNPDVLIILLLAIFVAESALSVPVLAIGNPQPFSQQQFDQMASMNPVEAAKQAIKTGNPDLINTLDFSRMDTHLSEKILDLALNPSFPANKLADALGKGAILKVSTLSKISDTQLSQPLPGGGRIRDKIPDLTQVNERSLADSIKNDAGFDRESLFAIKPLPGATTASEENIVTISGLSSLTIESSTYGLRSKNMHMASIGLQGFTAETAESFEIRKSSQTKSARDPLYPDIGEAPEERRLVAVHNASGLSIDNEGYLHIKQASIIEIFATIHANQKTSNQSPDSASATFGPGYPVMKHKPGDIDARLISAKDVRIKIFSMPTTIDPYNPSNETIIAEYVKEADIGRATFKEAISMAIDLELNTFTLKKARTAQTGDTTLIEPNDIKIKINEKMAVQIPTDYSVSLTIGETTATYHARDPSNILIIPIKEKSRRVLSELDVQTETSPEQVEPKSRSIDLTGGSLTFTKDDSVEIIESGNHSTIWLSDVYGFECAKSQPLSSYTWKPGIEHKALSIVSFSQEHMICALKEKSQQTPQPCTTKCTMIDLIGRKIISNGAIDYQRFHHNNAGAIIKTAGQQGMSSIITLYDSGTTELRYDDELDTIAEANLAEGNIMTYNPTNHLMVNDQAGHRLIKINPNIGKESLSKPLIQSIISKSAPPMMLAPDYAIQKTPGNRNIYLLFPGNPQIEQLIRQSDSRLAKYN